MGIILRPPDDQQPLQVEELAALLRSAGFHVDVDIAAGKRVVVEQIMFAYKDWIGVDHFDPTEIDELVKCYPNAATLHITHSELPAGQEPIWLLVDDLERLWFGECYPTDDDPRSCAIMKIASVIGYDAEGE